MNSYVEPIVEIVDFSAEAVMDGTGASANPIPGGVPGV